MPDKKRLCIRSPPNSFHPAAKSPTSRIKDTKRETWAASRYPFARRRRWRWEPLPGFQVRPFTKLFSNSIVRRPSICVAEMRAGAIYYVVRLLDLIEDYFLCFNVSMRFLLAFLP